LIRLPTDLNQRVQEGGTLLVPSRQRAHAARLAYAASQLNSGKRVWKTPDILPVEVWLIREIERRAAEAGADWPRLLSPAEEWLLWRQCTAEATETLDLLNRGAVAEGLRRASALAADFQIKPPTDAQLLGAESALLREVQASVEGRCRSLGAATVRSLARNVAHVGAQNRARESTVMTAASGFVTLPPLMAAMGVSGLDARNRLAEPQVVVASDELDELERIALWCKARVSERSDARVLVMLPGSGGARERLAALIQQAIDPQGWTERLHRDVGSLVAIEGGTALSRFPVVAHAVATLAWLGGERAEFTQIGDWLRAPYWQTPSAAGRARVDLWLREHGPMSRDLRGWMTTLLAAPAKVAEPARALAGQVLKAAEALGAGIASPRQWSERFRAVLDSLCWPGDRPRSSAEQQTLVRFHELLDEFGQLALSVRSMSCENALRWFKELAARTAYRPADDDAVVTIAPVLVDPVVQYDAIWVAGLHAEAFPQPVQPDPFLPLASQLAAGIPAASPAGRLEEAEALMKAWRAAADELVLSCAARSEDLQLLPSPLLAPWPAASSTTHASVWLPIQIHRDRILEAVEDVVGAPWSFDRPVPSGTRSLELQNQCPFRAYAELRLGSTELGVPEPGVAADVRGRLLHSALEVLWNRLGDSRTLASYSETALELLIQQAVAEAGDRVLGPGASGGSPVLRRECRRTARLIERLCTLERERTPFRVQATELESTLTVAGARVAIRIDRVDALESGGRAILDYKSGRRTAADWYGERPSHPQLLAYLAALGDDVVAMATVNVNAREVCFSGVASSPELLPRVKGVRPPSYVESGLWEHLLTAANTVANTVANPAATAWQARRREWLARVEYLASEFLAGRAAVDPKPGACEFCHVAALCRISDRGLDVLSVGLGETLEPGDD